MKEAIFKVVETWSGYKNRRRQGLNQIKADFKPISRLGQKQGTFIQAKLDSEIGDFY